ncbi:MAG: homoserine kinase [Thermoflexus sp.]|uniref:homoserine kinase n=1 Tax=Thermoflexus sp. TaxID=1969742 RepID=UPI0025FACB1B|nr:homoserine kinase [Thermoflexus sp.]MCS6964960.1 homoserine kinase [Thermoflexus sp.]
MRIRVRVPATTANLGPGFDAMGLALGLYNEIEAEPAPALEVWIEGEGADVLPRDSTNRVVRAAAALFERMGSTLPPMRLRCHNRIPLMSGLGSSAAAVVGGLALAQAWMGSWDPPEALLEFAAALEGHPDNVAPALLGGLVLVARDEDGLTADRVPIPPMRVVLALPGVTVSTEMARRLLPSHLPLADVVYQIGHAALLVHAFREGDWKLLGRAMRDRLHEPYRARLIPGYEQAVGAARAAGAAAVCISGSGPALAAFAPEGHEAIATAMAAAFEEAGVPARTWIVEAASEGVQVEVTSG